jgi:cell division protein FtsI (penicillin-binding protein 3)
VRVVLLLALVGIGARAGWLATDERALGRAEGQPHTQLRVPATRGQILDRNGRQFALSLDAPSVYVVPREVADAPGVERKLSRVLGIPRATLRKRLAMESNFVFLARWISEQEKQRVLEMGLQGVGIVPEPKRIYPMGPSAGTVIGFMNVDEEGVRGVEQLEHDWLEGSMKSYPVERDARGRKLPLPDVDPRATVGGDVRLTLDGAMQAAAESALDRAVTQHEASGGVIVTMDPRTGDLLAVAEAPGFDPNRFRKSRFADSRARSFTDGVEPGSVMKAFLLAGALEHGVVSLTEEIDCENGTLRVPGKTIHDHEPYGRLDLAGILAHSSNIGATKVAYRLGAERHFELLRAFGFGSRSGSGFPGESAGLLRGWERWRQVDHANVAFGQGMNVTAVQLAAATATLANRGIWRAPRLVEARRLPGQPWTPTRPGPMRRVVSAGTAEATLGLMEGVVGPDGTGRLAGLHGLRVAGKTGTAQKLDRETGRYFQDHFVAWFVGIVPADDPRLVTVVALDDPQGRFHTGGMVAAPLFAEVVAQQLVQLGIFTRPAPVPRAARPTLTEARAPGPAGAEDAG